MSSLRERGRERGREEGREGGREGEKVTMMEGRGGKERVRSALSCAALCSPGDR